MFTPSELALIQSGQWLPELSHFVTVTSPRNLDDNLNHARDEGEKIDLLIHTALNPHAPALIGLGEFLNSRDLTILAATLRGFASIGETLKVQNIDPNYRHHLEQLRYVLTANLDLHDDENPSVHLFKRLCHDAESGGSEMVRWAAAHALQELDYPLNLRRQLLTRPPAEISAEIWTKYELRLSESNRERDPSKVSEDIKFGIYGDTEKLFAKCGAGYSLNNIVRQVLRKTGIRGIRLALKCGNRPVVVEAINFAGELFNQIDPNSQDKRYKDDGTRQSLVDLLMPFLNQNDLDLRNLVAEKLNDKKNQYDISNRFVSANYRAKVAVIDTDWKRAIFLGDLAIPVLCDVVENVLILEEDKKRNLDCQIISIRNINEILVTDICRKTLILSPYLQHDNDSIRMEVCSLLKPHQSYLDVASNAILNALLFKLDLPYELTLDSLDQQGLESCLHIIETLRQKVQSVFDAAISSCLVSSIIFQNFLISKRQDFLNRIELYSRNVDGYYTDEIKRQADEIRSQQICKTLIEDRMSIKIEIQETQREFDKMIEERANAKHAERYDSIQFFVRESLFHPFFLIALSILLSFWNLVWGISIGLVGLAISWALRYSNFGLSLDRGSIDIQFKIEELRRKRTELKRNLIKIEEQIIENQCN